MPVNISVIGQKELRGFARDMRRWGDIEGIAMGRAAKDSLAKVRTQMVRDISKDLKLLVTPVRRRFGKRIFLDKVRSAKNQFRASLGLATRYPLSASYGKRIRESRRDGVKLTGYHFPKAFIIKSVFPAKKSGAVVERVNGRFVDVGIDFVKEADDSWERRQNIAADVIDARYDYWRTRLYDRFDKRRGSSSKNSFIKSLLQRVF